MKRDMTLYKYYDIYLLLKQLGKDELAIVLERAKKLGLDKVCAYCIWEVIDFFELNDAYIRSLVEKILSPDSQIRYTVINPNENKILQYNTLDVTERFFMENRIDDLIEVIANEKT